jgi:hypothetical protein
MKTGKPLRFLGWVLGGWVVMRLAMVPLPAQWHLEPGSPEMPVMHASSDGAGNLAPEGGVALTSVAPPGPFTIAASRSAGPFRDSWGTSQTGILAVGPQIAPEPLSSPSPSAPAHTQRTQDGAQPDPQLSAFITAPAPSAMRRESSLSMSAWMLWRPDAGPSLATGALLGGAQAGLRLDYRLWSAGRRNLSLYGRLSRALDRPHAEEGAMGLSWRPVEVLPVSLLTERRQRLGAGGRNGFAFLAAGGFGPKPVAPRLTVEGYAQAGVVTLPGAVAFADGRIALDYRLSSARAPGDLALGVAVSGGAQPGAERLDIGPQLRLRIPAANGHLRLSAEWRQRIAGSARPASGPAIALVAEF